MIRTRIIALLLPGYSPCLNWLARALGSDRVVLDDLHSFSRKSRIHRAKLRTPDGYQWLTIPFVSDDRRMSINQVRIDDRRPWLNHHLRALEFNYRNSLYFDYYEPEIRSDLVEAGESGLLIDAVRHLMHRQWIYLQLPGFPEWASEHFQSQTDLYQSICYLQDDRLTESSDKIYPKPGPDDIDHVPHTESLRPTFHKTIWQEPDSRNFQKPHPAAVQPAFTHPEYRQHFPGFVPGCSILDLLFEYGPDAWQVLDYLTSIIRPDNTSSPTNKR